MDDEIVAEIHKTREKLAARFDNDLRALTKYVKDKAIRDGRTIISFPPRRTQAASQASSGAAGGRPPAKQRPASAR
jgi:hypothetical protein